MLNFRYNKIPSSFWLLAGICCFVLFTCKKQKANDKPQKQRSIQVKYEKRNSSKFKLVDQDTTPSSKNFRRLRQYIWLKDDLNTKQLETFLNEQYRWVKDQKIFMDGKTPNDVFLAVYKTQKEADKGYADWIAAFRKEDSKSGKFILPKSKKQKEEVKLVKDNRKAQGYTDQDYQIYDYVMETTNISTKKAKQNMAGKYDLTYAEVDSIVSRVLDAMMSPNTEVQNKIKQEISGFANPRNITASRDYSLISYEQTFNAFNRENVHEKTKKYMKQILDMVMTETNIEKVRLAPYYPNAQNNDFVAVALLTVTRDEYVKAKDLEDYQGFQWKN